MGDHHYTTPGDRTRIFNLKSGARARVFFQDCVILPGGTQTVKLKTREKFKKNLHCLDSASLFRTVSFSFLPREIAFSLIIFFSLTLQMLEISSLYDIDTSRTRDTPSHFGDQDARGTAAADTISALWNYYICQKNAKMPKTELGNCSPLFELR